MDYNLGRLRQFLTAQEDAEGGATIFIFKKAGAYRESVNLPSRAKMTLRKIWHLAFNCKEAKRTFRQRFHHGN